MVLLGPGRPAPEEGFTGNVEVGPGGLLDPGHEMHQLDVPRWQSGVSGGTLRSLTVSSFDLCYTVPLSGSGSASAASP